MQRIVSLMAVFALLAGFFFAMPAEAANPWAPNTAYSIGSQVTYNGLTYECIQAHTSLTGWEPPNVPALWRPIQGNPQPTPTATTRPSTTPTGTPRPTATPTPRPTTTPVTCNYPNWVQGQNYYTGNIVRYNNAFYIAEHDNPGYDPTISTWFWDPYTCSGNPTPTPTSQPGGFGSIVSRAQFEQLFPNRNPFYTYDGLVTAAAFYPAFAGTGTTEIRKREAAAALANFSHETGGLVHITEIAQGEYCSPSAQWPCAPGKRYFGRGPIQLSWNFNYGMAGQALGLNLLADPDLVARDPAVAWKTALWYWMTQRGPGTMTPHDAMVNGHGFGETIRSINGSLECNGGNPGQVQSRINAYQSITNLLGVTPGNNLSC